MNDITIRPIARVKSDFSDKFGIPRQSGIVDELEARIVFEPEYRDPEALRGITQFSHIWVLWQFSESVRDTWSPTVRPPRLGGNVRMGVFATRSPFRPNSIGLSCVRLLRVEETCDGTVLVIGGADMLDGTPVFDIKPYIPYADSHPDAASGFAPDSGARLEVIFDAGIEKLVPAGKLEALKGVLANDPRPRYHNDPERIYAMDFAGVCVRFSVRDTILTVIEVSELK